MKKYSPKFSVGEIYTLSWDNFNPSSLFFKCKVTSIDAKFATILVLTHGDGSTANPWKEDHPISDLNNALRKLTKLERALK